MSCVTPRLVRSLIEVPFSLLALAFRCETEVLCTRLRELHADAETLQTEIKTLLSDLDILLDGITRCQADVNALQDAIVPVWDDVYRLCGNPGCDGDCRLCQEEDYLGEEEHTEKYCRRGRR